MTSIMINLFTGDTDTPNAFESNIDVIIGRLLIKERLKKKSKLD